eukprot:1660611-Amphidinium_carterae.1
MKVDNAIQSIVAHRSQFMTDILTAAPIGRGDADTKTGKTGYKDIFNPEIVLADLKHAQISEMAGNFFWQNSLQ